MCMKQMSVKQTYDKLGVEMIIESDFNCRYGVLLSDHLKVVGELKSVKDELSCLKFNGKRKLKIKDNVLQDVKNQRNELMDKNEKLEKYYEQEKEFRKEKDEEIERLKEKLDSLKECKENPLAKFRHIEEWREENKILKEENRRLKENNEVLTELLRGGEEKEKLWVLEYKFKNSQTNKIKEIKLDPQPKEELFELIGMDSDNWVSFNMNEVE